MSHRLTGYRLLATLLFPALGAVVAREKGQQGGLPPCITVPMVGYGQEYQTPIGRLVRLSTGAHLTF